MTIISKYLLFIYCIIISEIKSLLNKNEYFLYFVKNINIIKYIIYLLDKDKIIPIKSVSFQNYIKENQKKFKKINHEVTNNKIILVENFINQAAYGMSNAIISKFLSKINKQNILGFIRKGDIKSEIIFRSFGIKKFIYFKKKNFFLRIKYIYKALIKIQNINTIEQFCKIKIDNIDVGLPAYDSFIRYTGTPTVNKINHELVIFLADTIYAYDEFKNILKKNPLIKDLIQSETAFTPLNIFFNLSLKRKINVYSRLGTDSLSIRKYDNFDQRYFYRANISQKLFNEVFKNHKNKTNREIKKYYSSLEKKGFFGQDLRIRAKLKNKPELISKKKLIKKFKWNNDKKIAVFFFNHLIDVNFHSGPREIFKDNYTWSNYILNKIPKIRNVYWIIKDHPSQPFYKSKLNFEDKINYLEKKFKHIKIFRRDWDPSSLKKITDIAITSHGTVGIEYPSFGIKSLYVEKSFYSNIDIIKKIKNIKELNFKLRNLNNIKKISKSTIKKSNSFLYIRYVLLQNKCSLITPHDTSRQINEDRFWEENSKLIKIFQYKTDELFQMFRTQLKYNLRHTINFKKLKLRKKNYDDLSEK